VTAQPTSAPKTPDIIENTDGAIMIMGLFMAIMLVGFIYFMIGVGDTILFRERMQDTADAGVFAAAVVNARGMNYIALINCVMAAVLSVLVALKMIQFISASAMAIALVIALIPSPASPVGWAAITQLTRVVQATQKAFTKLQKPIYQILKVGNKAGKAVALSMPIAATAKVLDTTTGGYAPPAIAGIAWPLYQKLPLQDQDNCCKTCNKGKACGNTCIEQKDQCTKPQGCACDETLDDLCGKAGEYTGTVVGLPFKPIPIIGEKIEASIREFMTKSAKDFSKWFCGIGPATSFTKKTEVAFPESDSAKTCREKGDQAACDQAKIESDKAKPNGYTGECSTTECRQALKQARTQCKPEKGKETYAWQWVQKTEWVWWEKNEYGIVKEKTEDGEPPRAYGPSNTPPCGRGDASVDKGWRTSSGPVCKTKIEEPNTDWFASNEKTDPVERVTVTQILNCKAQIDAPLPNNDMTGLPDGGKDMRPATMASDAYLGEELFQLRTAVIGDNGRLSLGENGVKIAAIGKGDGGGGYKLATELSSFSFAQGEFFFDGGADRAEWLWHMHWRGRLRRFRMPEIGGGRSPLRQACATRASKVCNGLDKALDVVEQIIIH
jgi:hypothetical protein